MEIIVFLLLIGFLFLIAEIFSISLAALSPVILLLLLLVLFGPYLGYWRLKLRNRMMKEMADGSNLTFRKTLPNYWKYLFISNFKNIQVDVVEGVVNGHKIFIEDLIRSGITNLVLRNTHVTNMKVDEESVKGKLPSPTLGSHISFSSVMELKEYLETLRDKHELTG